MIRASNSTLGIHVVILMKINDFHFSVSQILYDICKTFSPPGIFCQLIYKGFRVGGGPV